MTVIVDSGFRRGTDVVKALAVGAHAVRIGRPWSVASFTKASGAKALVVFGRRRDLSKLAFALGS